MLFGSVIKIFLVQLKIYETTGENLPLKQSEVLRFSV